VNLGPTDPADCAPATSRTVETTAADGTMILGELRAFIHELDNAGAAESTRIEGRVSMKGGVKSLKATAVRFGDPEPQP
jgi:hypothetical protein